MKIFIWLVFTLTLGIAGHSQPVNQTISDPKDSSEILYGYFTRDILLTPPYKTWFQDGYDTYKPDKKAMKTLKRKLPDNLQIFIVMGSWCSDSQREIPHFLKITDMLGIDQKNITFIAVDHQKKMSHFNIEHLKIERVPTIIFYNNNREGRIVETPKSTLEKDMLEIVRSIK
jgi:hypothetical protein